MSYVSIYVNRSGRRFFNPQHDTAREPCWFRTQQCWLKSNQHKRLTCDALCRLRRIRMGCCPASLRGFTKKFHEKDFLAGLRKVRLFLTCDMTFPGIFLGTSTNLFASSSRLTCDCDFHWQVLEMITGRHLGEVCQSRTCELVLRWHYKHALHFRY